MIVGVLVFIDVATLTTWQIVDPFYRDTKKGTPEVSFIIALSLKKLVHFFHFQYNLDIFCM